MYIPEYSCWTMYILIIVHTHVMVHTCIYSVYTFQILYINVCTCNIQGHTMYILVYTMFMSLCLEYTISWQQKSQLFFNMQAISGHICSCQVVSRHDTTMLDCELWFWKDVNAGCECRNVVYTSTHQYILCTYMYGSVYTSTCMYIHICTASSTQ